MRKKLIVTDRAISFGGPGGPVFSEINRLCTQKLSVPYLYLYLNYLRIWAGVMFPSVILSACLKRFWRIFGGKAADTYEFWGVRE
jgi:pyruvate ferredoxin oxidoreductase alpha subunit